MKRTLCLLFIFFMLLGIAFTAFCSEKGSSNVESQHESSKRIRSLKSNLENKLYSLLELFSEALSGQEKFNTYCLIYQIRSANMYDSEWNQIEGDVNACSSFDDLVRILHTDYDGINVVRGISETQKDLVGQLGPKILASLGIDDFVYCNYYPDYSSPASQRSTEWNYLVSESKEGIDFFSTFIRVSFNTSGELLSVYSFLERKDLQRLNRLTENEKNELKKRAIAIVEDLLPNKGSLKEMKSITVSNYSYKGSPAEPLGWVWIYTNDSVIYDGLPQGNYFLIGVESKRIYRYFSYVFEANLPSDSDLILSGL